MGNLLESSSIHPCKCNCTEVMTITHHDLVKIKFKVLCCRESGTYRLHPKLNARAKSEGGKELRRSPTGNMALEVLGISDRQNEWASGHDYMSMGMRERGKKYSKKMKSSIKCSKLGIDLHKHNPHPLGL